MHSKNTTTTKRRQAKLQKTNSKSKQTANYLSQKTKTKQNRTNRKTPNKTGVKALQKT